MSLKRIVYATLNKGNMMKLNSNFSAIADGGLGGSMTGAAIKALYELEPNAFTDADRVLLDGIEPGATADMSDAEIRAAYENGGLRAAFTTALKDKLDAIDENATDDLTGAEIVALIGLEADANLLTDAELAKLAGLESSKYLGVYVSKTALETAHPPTLAIEVGAYAHVDGGVGQPVQLYIFDRDDLEWYQMQGGGSSMTPAQVKSAYESNANTEVFSTTEKTKLGTIEQNAKDDQNAAEVPFGSSQGLSSTNVQAALDEIVVDLTTGLAGKAADVHGHTTSDITGLDAALTGKSDTGHPHVAGDISDFDSSVAANAAVAANSAKVSFPGHQNLDHKADKTNVLELDNTDSFDPTQDYHPATRKFVLDEIANAGGAGGDMLASTWSPVINAKANESDVLTKTNTDPFDPTGLGDYVPATKKYVDDSAASAPVDDVVGLTGSISKGALQGALNMDDGATDDQTGAEIKAAYEGEANTNAFEDLEKAKLAGIEDNATADQTGAEIKAAYEAEADTNAFTDSEKSKLAGLESSKFLGTYTTLGGLQSAHPTPAEGSYAHVDAGPGQDVAVYIWDNDDTQYQEQAAGSSAETAASIKTKYESNADTNVFDNAAQSKLAAIEENATADQTGAEIKSAYEGEADTNVFDDAAQAKLGTIEDNAKDDQNANEVPFDNTGTTLAATDAEAAIAELDEKVQRYEPFPWKTANDVNRVLCLGDSNLVGIGGSDPALHTANNNLWFYSMPGDGLYNPANNAWRNQDPNGPTITEDGDSNAEPMFGILRNSNGSTAYGISDRLQKYNERDTYTFSLSRGGTTINYWQTGGGAGKEGMSMLDAELQDAIDLIPGDQTFFDVVYFSEGTNDQGSSHIPANGLTPDEFVTKFGAMITHMVSQGWVDPIKTRFYIAEPAQEYPTNDGWTGLEKLDAATLSNFNILSSIGMAVRPDLTHFEPSALDDFARQVFEDVTGHNTLQRYIQNSSYVEKHAPLLEGDLDVNGNIITNIQDLQGINGTLGVVDDIDMQSNNINNVNQIGLESGVIESEVDMSVALARGFQFKIPSEITGNGNAKASKAMFEVVNHDGSLTVGWDGSGWPFAYSDSGPIFGQYFGSLIYSVPIWSATSELILGNGAGRLSVSNSLFQIKSNGQAAQDGQDLEIFATKSSNVNSAPGDTVYGAMNAHDDANATKRDGGNVTLVAGSAAVNEIGDGGDVNIAAGAGANTGANGNVIINNQVYGQLTGFGNTTAEAAPSSSMAPVTRVWQYDNMFDGVTLAQNLGRITCPIDGRYRVTVNLNFTAGAVGTQINFGVRVGPSVLYAGGDAAVYVTGEHQTVSLECFVDTWSGFDYIEVHYNSPDGATSLTVRTGSFMVQRVSNW